MKRFPQIRLRPFIRLRLPTQYRFVHSTMPTAPSSISSTPVCTSSIINKNNGNLDFSLETDISLERLIELLEHDKKILNHGSSALARIFIDKCRLEICKLLNGELESFNEVMDLVEPLALALRDDKNRHLKKRLELEMGSTGCLYLVDVAQHRYQIGRLFNEELRRLLELKDKTICAKQTLNFLKLNHLLLKRLFADDCYYLEIHQEHRSKVAQLFVDSSKVAELFEALLNLNSRHTINSKSMGKVRSLLKNGSSEERALYNFYSLFDTDEYEPIKAKILRLYSFETIRGILVYHIQKGDHLRAKLYMDLLVSRFAIIRNSMDKKTAKDQSIVKTTNDLYTVMMYYSTALGNYRDSLSILEKMLENGVEITPRLCHVLITSLRKKNLYEGSLELLRVVPKFLTKKLEHRDADKAIFVNELLALLRAKFNDPELVLAHLITVYPKSTELLNELKLLNPMVNQQPGHLEDTKVLRHAVLNDFFVLKDRKYPTLQNMTEVYISLFNHISTSGITTKELNNVQFYKELFDRFLSVASQVQREEATDNELRHHPFSSVNMDEGLLNVFVRKMLVDFNKPRLALTMTKRFLTRLKLRRFNADNLVHIFYQHPHSSGPYYEEMRVILKYFKVELSFKLIVANIFKSYNRGEVDIAHEWYKLLLKKDFLLVNRRFITFIHSVGWEFPENFNYKLLEVLKLPIPQNEEFSMYNEEENLETFDHDFVQKLIKELNQIQKKQQETAANE